MNYRKKAILMVVALFCLNIAILAQAVSLKMNNVSVKEAMTQLKNCLLFTTPSPRDGATGRMPSSA